MQLLLNVNSLAAMLDCEFMVSEVPDLKLWLRICFSHRVGRDVFFQEETFFLKSLKKDTFYFRLQPIVGEYSVALKQHKAETLAVPC